MKNIKQPVGAVIGALALAAATVVGVQSAHATGDDPEPCVPSEAWTQTIEHPAKVKHHPAIPAVTETIPGMWQNFSPNKYQKKFVGPPAHPVDERGTWNHMNKPIPPGHAGPDGVYQNGNGNGSWFYRQAEKVVIVTPEIPAWDEILKEAWTETIEHPAVTCEDDPTDEPTPTEPTPTDEPTDEPTEDPTPQEPTEEPETPSTGGDPDPTPETPEDPVPGVPDPTEPEGDTSSQRIEQRCLAGALVTETFEDGQRVSVSTENGHPRCAPEPGDQPIIEEGM